MKRVLILILALLMLTGCGKDPVLLTEDGYHVKETTVVGTKITEHRNGADGPLVWRRCETSDGTIVEEKFNESGICIWKLNLYSNNSSEESKFDGTGNLIWSKTIFTDGSYHEQAFESDGTLTFSYFCSIDGTIFENHYYPSGNASKTIAVQADGSSIEWHFADDGNPAQNISGTVTYHKEITADGEVIEDTFDYADTERIENSDGTYWQITRMEDGLVIKNLFDNNGRYLETIMERPDGYVRTETYVYTPDGRMTASNWEDTSGGKGNCTYDEEGHMATMTQEFEDSSTYTEYYPNGNVRYRFNTFPDGTEESRYNEEGYCVYHHAVYPKHKIEEEGFGDETGKLIKYIKDGKVYEGDQIPADVRELYVASLQFRPEA